MAPHESSSKASPPGPPREQVGRAAFGRTDAKRTIGTVSQRSSDVGVAVTALYVPGDRPDRFDKALEARPDFVIFDWEDAVSPARKGFARQAVVEYLAAQRSAGGPGRVRLQVRVNARHTPWWSDDLAALAGLGGPATVGGVRVPKVESALDLRLVAERVPATDLYAMIETARGVQATAEIAASGVVSVGLGEADLGSDLGISDDAGFDPIRSGLVVAARAAGLVPPMMSVWTALDDEAGLLTSCRAGHARGFLGRAAIHPRQLPAIRSAFTPSAEELDAARMVLAALAGAERDGSEVAVTPDGRMVDRAMRVGAERVVRLAAQLTADGQRAAD